MNRGGYTLVESLLVLAILSLLLILWPRSDQSVANQIEERLFFSTLSSSIQYCQQLALTSQYQTKVRFDAQEQQILFYLYGNYCYEILTLPEDLFLLNQLQIQFNQYGHVSYFGTVRFQNNQNQRYNLVFQLGNGQFEIR